VPHCARLVIGPPAILQEALGPAFTSWLTWGLCSVSELVCQFQSSKRNEISMGLGITTTFLPSRRWEIAHR
jgi:hypothetical protein